MAAAGFSLYISRLNAQPWKSLRCASAIGAELRAAGEAPSRYHADGVHLFDELRVLRGTMPAVQVEAGLIVGPAEEERLRDPLVRRRIARAISGGVRSCLR
jgi:N-acetylmuramoyl-L-alanine amidase